MNPRRNRSYDDVKRLIDVVTAAAGLVLGAPAMGVAAVLVRYKLGSPVLFRQRRPGLNGEPFWLVKFRTMNEIDPASGITTETERLDRFGTLLRSTSIDELPTLWNVLRGDMSLVGPRPLLTEYLGRYSPSQARRHEVRPGITGLAQVRGRNTLSWEEKFAADIEYVDNRSFWLDVRILASTIASVIRRDGISAAGHVTMPEFTGTSGSEESS